MAAARPTVMTMMTNLPKTWKPFTCLLYTSPDLLGELEPAYAMTVHKAQGSEYRAVILAACDGAPMLLTRGAIIFCYYIS